jgi:hypothetical protein
VCCSYSDLCSAQLSDTVVVICIYESKYLVNLVTNPKLV